VRAVVQGRYGSPHDLRVADVDVPAIAADQVLVRVRAASVHPDVWHVVTGYPYALRAMGAGLRRPRNPVPGTDMAGVVEAVGADVTTLAPGDEVFGETLTRTQWTNGGAFAEYVAVRATALARKPANVSFEQAAAVPTSGLITLRCLVREGHLEPGHRVLVNGAAGGVGSLGVQLAKGLGAHVTAVDRTDRLDLLRDLGADVVIDYTTEDFTRRPDRYDVILDIPGNRTLAEYRSVLNPGGRYVLVGHDDFGRKGHRWLGGIPKALGQVAMSPFIAELPGFTRPIPVEEAMATLAGFLASGALTPLVDSTSPLEGVADAIDRLTSGQARGKVLLTP
jgi:NADPH:quinone reductase-like Zn-dependent oxidoreductase